MEAAENNHLDAVKYLIKAGALVDPKVRHLVRITFLFYVKIFHKDELGAVPRWSSSRNWQPADVRLVVQKQLSARLARSWVCLGEH